MKTLKKSLALLLAIVTLMGCFSVIANAETIEYITFTEEDFGSMYLTNSKFTKRASAVTLYGKYDYLNFKISATDSESTFFYELYSDKKYTNLIASDYTEDTRKDHCWSSLVSLKGLKSGTYYGIYYCAYINNGYANIDINSVTKFKVVIKRVPDFDLQVVLPKSIKATANGPQITWYQHSAAAAKYIIYRRPMKGKTWTKVGTVKAPTLTFVDKSVKNTCGEYIYTIKAVNKKGVATRYLYSGININFASAPTVTLTPSSNNRILVSWDMNSTFKYHIIYRREVGGKWKIINKGYGYNSLVDENIEPGKTYEYTVRRGRTDGGPDSAYIATKPFTLVAAPNMHDIALSDNKPYIQWDAVDGAIGYTVYRKALDVKESWTKLGKVDASVLSFVDETADINNAYTYTVRSEGETARGSYYSDGKAFVTLETPEFTIEPKGDFRDYNKTTNTKITVSVVDYADVFTAYRKNANGEWVKAGSQSYNKKYSSSSSVVLTVAAKNGENEFCVTAGRTNIDNIIESPIGENACSHTFYPSLVAKFTNYTDRIAIEPYVYNQNYTGELDVYNVYRSISGAEEYTLIGSNISEDVFNDTDAQRDTYYDYIIKGVYNGVEETGSGASRKNHVNPRRPEDKTPSIVSKEYHQESPSSDRFSTFIYFDSKNNYSEAVYYIYDSNRNTFKELYSNGYSIDKSVPVGTEYTFAVKYNVNNCFTPLEESVFTYTHSFPEKVTVKGTNSNTNYTLTINPFDNAVKYELWTLDTGGYLNSFTNYTISGDGPYSLQIPNKTMCYFLNYHSNLAIKTSYENGDTVITYLDNYFIDVPELEYAYRESNSSVKICWKYNCQKRPHHFNVYRKTANSGWTIIGQTKTDGDFYDNTAKKGVAYTYTVRAFNADGSSGGYNKTGVTCKATY